MKVVSINHTPTMTDALEAVDLLRQAIESGHVRAFFAVGVTADDELLGFHGSSSPVSRLRITGALSHALYDWQAGNVG